MSNVFPRRHCHRFTVKLWPLALLLGFSCCRSVGDKAFRPNFADKTIETTQSRNAKIALRMLDKLEDQAGGVEFDAESSASTFQHVLPQAPASDWAQFEDRDQGMSSFRLGSLVLLEAETKDIANPPFHLKRAALQCCSAADAWRLANAFTRMTNGRPQA